MVGGHPAHGLTSDGTASVAIRVFALRTMGPLFEDWGVLGRRRMPHRSGARACVPLSFPAPLGGLGLWLIRGWWAKAEEKGRHREEVPGGTCVHALAAELPGAEPGAGLGHSTGSALRVQGPLPQWGNREGRAAVLKTGTRSFQGKAR